MFGRALHIYRFAIHMWTQVIEKTSGAVWHRITPEDSPILTPPTRGAPSTLQYSTASFGFSVGACPSLPAAFLNPPAPRLLVTASGVRGVMSGLERRVVG